LEKHIAFITYETPFAPGGGIAAVMKHLPPAISAVSNIPTYVITPFHHKINQTANFEPNMQTMAIIDIDFYSQRLEVEVKSYQDKVNWIFLKPIHPSKLSKKLFAGTNHPYDLSSSNSDIQSTLLRDSLLFGKAASAALKKICPKCQWIILMQDWEAATCTLSFNQIADDELKILPFLTLHNSYDCGLNKEALSEIGLGNEISPGGTILEAALPHIRYPIFTVSDQFALDLSQEINQSEIMIPHIVNQISSNLVGINNGPFINLQIPKKIYQAGLKGDLLPIAEWKKKKRKSALRIIRSFKPKNDELVWGYPAQFSNDDLPWFVMAGRDDSRQKGYELACLAASKFLEQSHQACFIFFPIPGDEGIQGIEFLRDLADKFPSNVICYPFIFRKGYFPIIQGASFGMMPSYYEPFGMANEYFLNGTSCLGRATGGITQQIVPIRDAISFTGEVELRANRWHSTDIHPSGFLFREKDTIKGVLNDWEEINAASYLLDPAGKNRLEDRKQLSLVKEISGEMNACMLDASELYSSQRDKYYQALINGAQYITENFSWDKAAQKYIDFVIL
jgi:glycogen synthase